MLLRKKRCHAEVYNDLDGEIVNLFRVARDQGPALAELLRNTPFAREEYRLAFDVADDPIEQARRTVARSIMGFGSNALNRSIQSGFRSNSNRSGTTPARDWMTYPTCLEGIIERLRGVVIENRPFEELVPQHDGPKTCFYVDPPYVHASRAMVAMHGNHGYAHEMTDEQHACLADTLRGVRGMVVLSGYHSDLYDSLYGNWERVEREALADGAAKRLEVLWFNPAAWDALHEQSLFRAYS